MTYELENSTHKFTVICGHGEPLLRKETAIKLGVLRIGANVAVVSDGKSMTRQTAISQIVLRCVQIKHKTI